MTHLAVSQKITTKKNITNWTEKIYFSDKSLSVILEVWQHTKIGQ